MSEPAVFLDRDDTLVVDAGFIDHPDKVALVRGASEAVRRFRRAGFKVIVASNQSGVARGYFDENRLAKINQRVQDLLAADGQRLDAIYCCPFLDGPEATVDAYRCDSDLRKPRPGMLLKAAREMDLDLTRSWMIGDAARDIEAGMAAGCRTILIEANGNDANNADTRPTHRTRSILEAVMIVERETANDRKAERAQSKSAPPENIKLLTEIRDILDRHQREAMHDDFSVKRLMGTLVQMLALVSAGWGVFAMFSESTGAALTRFALAGFLQLLVVSLTLAERRG